MPMLVAAIIGALLQVAASLVGRILLALSIGYVTYRGFGAMFDAAFNIAKNNLSGFPAEIGSFLGWLWVDKALNLLASSYTAALTIKMAGSTTLTKFAIKK